MKKFWIAVVRLCGWKFELPERGSRPELERCVFAVAPHTSVSDFLVGAAFLWALDVNGRIFIKKEFFRWPLGGLLRRLGAIPIDRGNRRNDMVGRAVSEFAKGGVFTVAITPEGTRRPVRRWKRGFWEIAHRAGVPIVPAYIDFGRRRIWLGEALWTGDDAEADICEVRRGFRCEMARHPEGFVEL